MPRYLIEMAAVDDTRLDAAEHLATQRFPEVAVEQRYTAREDEATQVIWVCRAPSEAHLVRWSDVAQLELRSVRRIDVSSRRTQDKR